jgi:hypothetical protein
VLQIEGKPRMRLRNGLQRLSAAPSRGSSRCEEAIGDEVTMLPTLGSPGDGRR